MNFELEQTIQVNGVGNALVWFPYSLDRTWSHAFAVISDDKITLFRDATVHVIPLPRPSKKSLAAITTHAAWALVHHVTPFLVFNRASLLYLFDASQNKLVSCLRGHGGPIQSIAVHPRNPHIVITTSRDTTVRIYNLNLSPQLPPPPLYSPEGFTGPGHGMGMSEPEATGPQPTGRCVMVLAGGSGGHSAAVLAAAFHPTLPLIATAGLDRSIKIWFVRPDLLDCDDYFITTEDKPIFSSSAIHKAAIRSVAWVSDDILVTHCGPSPQRDEHDRIVTESGSVIVWQWLGKSRFFPPNSEPQRVLRACTSDFQESSSFKLLAHLQLPAADLKHIANVDVFVHPVHEAILLLTLGTTRHVSLFRLDQLHNTLPRITIPEKPAPLILSGTLPPSPQVRLPPGTVEMLKSAKMGPQGNTILGIGTRGTVWLWKRINHVDG